MTVSIQKSDAPNAVFRGKLALRMLAEIFRGKYAEGDRLVEQDLAESYGVSRTPIREALGELAAVGLIEVRANRGAIVLPFGRRELANIYQLREILEAAATKLACGKIPAMKLENLHARLTLLQRRTDEQWSQRAMALDRRLHDLIAEHSGNARLAQEIANYRGFLQAVRLTVGNHQHAQRHGIVHHLRIIEALLANDADAAHDAMVHHIQFTAGLATQALFGERVDQNQIPAPSSKAAPKP